MDFRKQLLVGQRIKERFKCVLKSSLAQQQSASPSRSLSAQLPSPQVSVANDIKERETVLLYSIYATACVFSRSIAIKVERVFSYNIITHAADPDYMDITNQQLSFDLLTPSPACVDITVNDDQIFEEDEQFQLTLSLPSPPPSFPPLTIDPPTAVVTIIDDDGKQH